jgi:hypothetical protein
MAATWLRMTSSGLVDRDPNFARLRRKGMRRGRLSATQTDGVDCLAGPA